MNIFNLFSFLLHMLDISVSTDLLLLLFFLVAQGLMLTRQVLLLLEPFHQPFFVMGFSEIGSCELFAVGRL
jgi:hypothetical protein